MISYTMNLRLPGAASPSLANMTGFLWFEKYKGVILLVDFFLRLFHYYLRLFFNRPAHSHSNTDTCSDCSIKSDLFVTIPEWIGS